MEKLPDYVRTQYKPMEYPSKTFIKRSSYYLEDKRHDLTHLRVYTIDPSGSTDADDAFSIVDLGNNKCDLYVHIADPTSYFEPNDSVFKCIRLNGVSQYPSLNPAKHMFHTNYVNACTLMNGIKPAISVIFHTENNSVISTECVLSTVQCEPEYRLSYTYAGKIFEEGEHEFSTDLERICDITDIMRAKRTIRTCEYAVPAELRYKDGRLSYVKISDSTIKAKRLIEELAIQTNNVIAQLLMDNGDKFLNRQCNSLNGIMTETGNLIFDIITNQMRAKYDTQVDKHVILNLETYCHFTSPLRRFSDCITHFILKHSLIKGIREPLFDNKKLSMYAIMCNAATKQHRVASFSDYKYRLYQYITQELRERDSVQIKYIHNGLERNFVNALIFGIDDYNINVCYTLFANNRVDRELVASFNGKADTLNITKCIIKNKKFDEGTLPELEDDMMRYFS
jgi:exoribonuclease-2